MKYWNEDFHNYHNFERDQHILIIKEGKLTFSSFIFDFKNYI